MKIRTRLILNTQSIANKIDQTTKIVDEYFDLQVKKAYTELETDLTREVSNYPPPSVHPFVWSNNPIANSRARRWYFNAIRRGLIPTDGVRYKRQGNLIKNIVPTLTKEGTNYMIRIGLKDSRLKFVVGTFDQRRGKGFQIPGHNRTGWYYIQDKTKLVYDTFLDKIKDFPEELKARIRNR